MSGLCSCVQTPPSCRLSWEGKVAERDIVQFVPFKKFMQVRYHQQIYSAITMYCFGMSFCVWLQYKCNYQL